MDAGRVAELYKLHDQGQSELRSSSQLQTILPLAEG